MAEPKEIRDVIHGFVFRTSKEEALIDTKVFQRLRGIKQLAMANLVYPGALHTRFDHSIGVMHIAGRMAEQLKIPEEDKETIKYASLLHDIGHGPFSHVSEDILKNYYKKEESQSFEKEEIHEKITCDIIKYDEEISTELSDKDREKVIELISMDRHESIKKNIITGPIDADKLDYLLRDSYYCGVKYGVYDIERLIGTLTDFDEGQDKIIAITEGGIYAVEQFVLSKYHMSTQVYRHKIRLITDAMIIKALELGIEEDKIDFLMDLYKYEGSKDFINNYLKWDDAKVINEIIFNLDKRGYCKDIFTRLRDRKLFKLVFHRQLSEFSALVRDSLNEIQDNPALKLKLEIKISDYLSTKTKKSVDKNFVLIVVLNIKSVRAEKKKDSVGNIIVRLDSGENKIFDDCSTLFKSINQKEVDQFIEVFAPISYDTDLVKRKMKASFNQEIFDLITTETEQFIKE